LEHTTISRVPIQKGKSSVAFAIQRTMLLLSLVGVGVLIG
jgi:hypothetical protein